MLTMGQNPIHFIQNEWIWFYKLYGVVILKTLEGLST